MMDYDKIWQSIEYKKVWIIAVPIPPNPIKSDGGIIYMPDSYGSKSYDLKFDRSDVYSVIKVNWSEIYGPCILMSTKIKDLFSFRKYVTPRFGSFCATVSAYREHLNGKLFGFESIIDCLDETPSSCNKGSHICIPDAPYMNSLIQLFCASSGYDCEIIKYLSYSSGSLLFEDIDFSHNQYHDNIFSKLMVDQSRYCRKSIHDINGVDNVSFKFVKTLINNGAKNVESNI